MEIGVGIMFEIASKEKLRGEFEKNLLALFKDILGSNFP